jgi:rod shape-determining protein MreC
MRKRHFWALLLLLALLVAGLGMPLPARVWLREKAMTVASFPLGAVDWFRQFTTEVDTNLQTLKDAQEEVERLRRVNEDLAMKTVLQQNLAEENDRLREMLNFKEASSLELLPARVISRDPSSWWNTVQINRGWQNDPLAAAGKPALEADLPVVTPRGVVGKTGVVSAYTTEVILLVDESCKVSAKVEGSNAQGIVVGEGHFDKGEPRLRMKYLDRNANVAAGERVFTSGLGGVFPEGLLIGVVVEVEDISKEKNFGLYREAVLRPNVDLVRLRELFILTGVRPPQK